MGNVKVNLKDLEKLRDKFEKLNNQIPEFIKELTNEIAGRLLRAAKEETPTGIYGKEIEIVKKVYKYENIEGQTTKNGKPKRKRIDTGETKIVKGSTSSKTGGTLKRGWTIGEIVETKDSYTVEVINPVYYARYVEYGHRTSNHKGWVKGQFMLTIAKKNLESNLEKVVSNKMKKFFKNEGGGTDD